MYLDGYVYPNANYGYRVTTISVASLQRIDLHSNSAAAKPIATLIL